MTRVLLFLFSVTTTTVFGQITEDFADGNFADGNPLTWTASQTSGGDDFVITSGEVQSNGPTANGDLYLSTNLGLDFANNDVVWTFKVRYAGGAPSGTNRVFIYLMSDVEDVAGSPQGYYIRMGETGSGDGIDLFKTNSGTAIINDAGDLVGSGIDVHIRVTRTSTGMWTLEADATGGDTFSTIGNVTDTDFTTGDYFGLYVDHTSTRFDDYFFDDFTLTTTPLADTDPPLIQSVTAISDTQVDVTFNENVDETTAETTGNYALDGSINVTGAMRDATNNAIVHLTTDPLTNGQTYTVTINNVEDENSNVIASNSQDMFQYLVFEEAVQFDVVINEFMADPNPVIGLPDAEYVELYNRSSKFLDLENWTLDGQMLASFQFNPDSYVLIVDDGDAGLFSSFTNVLTVTTLSLNNSSTDVITLQDDNATEIHSISFTGSTGGTSTELINPNGPDYSSNNYGLSTDPDGGTPEAQNSIFDDTPDTTAPTISSISVVSNTELDLTFDEPVDETTAENTANYSIDGGITVSAAMRDDSDNSIVHLTVSALVSGDTRTLTVNNVEDLSGNAIASNSQVNFQYVLFEEAVQFDVVINEFMADPDPVIGLPNAEYVELYNRSNKFLDLANWELDGQTLGTFQFDPDSYVLIVEDDDLALFSSFTNVLAVTTLSLNNSTEDMITLQDDDATEIHSISFTGSTGGTSTELINPNGPDYSSNNYGLSTDPDGGTPETQNSIFDDTPDTTAPTISSISVVSNTELDLTFDEPVDETTAENIANYMIDAGINVTASMRDDDNNALVHLTVSTLVSGETRTLTVNNVQDISGNAIAANSQINFEYIETVQALVNEVVINEFYAIPDEESGLPNAEFVELFNNTSKFIDLENWTLSDATGTSGAFPSFILRPNAYVILVPVGETSSFQSFGDVLEVPSMKSLNNSGDEIRITNGLATDIHQITFTSAVSGVSTEMINPNGPDFSQNNYGLSTDPGGGTPGEQNSIFDDTPDTTPPVIVSIKVVSSTELDLTFDEPVDEVTAETTSNYSIDGGITVITVVRDDTNNTTVHLTVSILVSEEVRTLTVNNVDNLSGNTIAANSTINFEYIATVDPEPGDVVINEFLSDPVDNNDDFVELYNRSTKFFNLAGWKLSDESSVSAEFPEFVLRPGSYVIIYDEDATIDYSGFGDAIAVPSLTLNNTDDQIEILDSTDTRIAFLLYTDQPQEAISLELINPDDPCISESSYALSTDGSGHTSGRQNSVFDSTPDTDPPTVTSSGFSGTLTITFSEVMDESSLMNGTYTVSGLTVSGVNTSDFPTSVEITFAEILNTGVIYELTLSGVTDCWGNAIAETTVSFGLGRSPGFNELLITEIQFDPDPSVGLPDVEFIEIYNNTNDLINLDGVDYSDASSSVTLPASILNPMEYYVLTTNSGASEFSGVNAIGVSGFPSLSNSGEQLILSRNEELIFSINYDPDWHDEEKADGGYTLEMKDLLNPCIEDFNWGSSENVNGGTPGLANSNTEAVPDNFGPEVSQVIAVSMDTVRVDFSEKIDPGSVQTATVAFDPALNTNTLFFDFRLPASMFIALNEDLVGSNSHSIQISGIRDCNGNEVQAHEITFALPSEAEAGDVLLSEVLFNPRTNGVDFVEVYNASDKHISLQNWQLARITENGVSDMKTVEEELVLAPGAFRVFTTDADVLLNNYLLGVSANFTELATLPTYANDTGNVVLLNELEEVQEQFHYEDDYHYSLLESTDGVSLERISYSVDVNDPNNWRSASSTQGFATPGYQNSQALSFDAPSGTVEAEPKVFIPGNSGSGRDFTTINYQFDQPGKFANVTIYDQTGRLIKNVAEGALLSTSGFMRWDGTTNNGDLARLGYYVVVFEVYDSAGSTEVIKETIVVGRDF